MRRGDPAEVVPEEGARTGSERVYWNADVTPSAVARDARVEQALRIPVRRHYGGLVHPPGSILTKQGRLSRVFTPFHRVWRSTPWGAWPEPGDAIIADVVADALPAPDGDPPRAPGEAGAEATLRGLLERVDTYDVERDRLGETRTSELSIALRFGTLSPRHVVEVVGESGPGREAFVRQLAWRDWYAHLLLEIPSLPERSMREEYDDIEWRDDAAGFAAWKEGRTGYPIVDAGMRQLARTGFMHNRARMITASFLVKDLLVDWRHGERYFRHVLADGDVAQNVGNWQWVAGTGPDAAPYFRVMSPVTQSRRHDPSGEYLRRWVPELAALDDDSIHAPWELGPLELAAHGVTLGVDYPAPIVDHAEARGRTLAAYQAARSRD